MARFIYVFCRQLTRPSRWIIFGEDNPDSLLDVFKKAQGTLAKYVAGITVTQDELLDTADAVRQTVLHATEADFDEDDDDELGRIQAFRLHLHKKLLPYRERWDALANIDDPNVCGKCQLTR